MNGHWPFRPGTAVGVGILVLLAIGVSVLLSKAAEDALPQGFAGAGEPVYGESCSACHGLWGEGTAVGPSLLVVGLARPGYSNERMADAIRKGTGSMPGSDIDLEEAANVVAYVRDLQEAAGLE